MCVRFALAAHVNHPSYPPTPHQPPTHTPTPTQEDLLAELDALVEEETEAKLTEVPGALPAKRGKVAAPTAPTTAEEEAALPDLPAVPTNKPAVPQSAVAVRGESGFGWGSVFMYLLPRLAD